MLVMLSVPVIDRIIIHPVILRAHFDRPLTIVLLAVTFPSNNPGGVDRDEKSRGLLYYLNTRRYAHCLDG